MINEREQTYYNKGEKKNHSTRLQTEQTENDSRIRGSPRMEEPHNRSKESNGENNTNTRNHQPPSGRQTRINSHNKKQGEIDTREEQRREGRRGREVNIERMGD